MKYGFVARHRSVWPVRTLCRTLGVSHGGFYDWLGRGSSDRALDNERLAGRIRESFAQSDRTYGSPGCGEICTTGASTQARIEWPG